MFKIDREFFWPILEGESPSDKELREKWISSIVGSVKDGDWSKHSEVALEEARRIYDAEADRKKGADTKAGIYLAAITALIPVLVSLIAVLWGDHTPKAIGLISLFIFACAVTYLLRAGYWAFNTLKVKGFNQLDPQQIAACWIKPNPPEALAKALSLAVVKNYEQTNRKISCILMTHTLLIRAFVTFAVLLTLQAILPTGAWLFDFIVATLKPEVTPPLIMCFS